MTHPGVGALTALAFVLIIGTLERFRCGKQVTSYLGLVPLEKSSGNRRWLGHITKQGSSTLRFCPVLMYERPVLRFALHVTVSDLENSFLQR